MNRFMQARIIYRLVPGMQGIQFTKFKGFLFSRFIKDRCCPIKFGGSSIVSFHLSTDGVTFCLDTKSNQKNQGSRKAG